MTKFVRFALASAVTWGLIQTAAAQSRRSVGDVVLWPEVQVEYALRGDDYLLFSLGGPRSTQTDDNRILGLDYTQLRIGYEHFWSERWSGGGTLRVGAYSTYGSGGGDVEKLKADLTPEAFLRHWTTFGGFNFRQRLGLEYNIPAAPADSRALARLRFDLDRPVSVGERLLLRPRLAYEASAYLRLQRDDDEPKERVIDFGSLRGEVGCRVSDHFDFTPWIAWQTTYAFTLPQTDVNGNVTIRGGRRNFVTPVVGLDARFTVFRGGPAFERRQLPTQH